MPSVLQRSNHYTHIVYILGLTWHEWDLNSQPPNYEVNRKGENVSDQTRIWLPMASLLSWWSTSLEIQGFWIWILHGLVCCIFFLPVTTDKKNQATLLACSMCPVSWWWVRANGLYILNFLQLMMRDSRHKFTTTLYVRLPIWTNSGHRALFSLTPTLQ